MEQSEKIWVVDFGSQYTALITRKTREIGYGAEVLTLDEAEDRFGAGEKPVALVLSGGPQSVFEDAHDYGFFFADEELPALGICYGMQLMGQHFGGEVEKGEDGEYGHAKVSFKKSLGDVPQSVNAWMSHADHVVRVPDDFTVIAESENEMIAGMRHTERPMMALQFHPEVDHTEHGNDILAYFYAEIAGLEVNWSSDAMLAEGMAAVDAVGDGDILCAFSGGVDSLVAATLVERALPGRVHCFFVDNGLLRPQDYTHIEELKKETNLKIEVIDAKEEFLSQLRGLDDPEKKRKIIGTTFIEIFEQKISEYKEQHDVHFTHLLQGTLYPDVIESLSPFGKGGKSVTIKSHHNVGGLPDRMKLTLLEPLRYFFKDEVRAVGVKLGLPDQYVYRHPFPGPGIGVRVLGGITDAAIRAVQESDQILYEELLASGEYNNVWQAFTVFLPVSTVGVKGDSRAYENVICIRAVNSSDAMTATWSRVPHEMLAKASARITNEVAGITRVVYDITSKPPGTIEWE